MPEEQLYDWVNEYAYVFISNLYETFPSNRYFGSCADLLCMCCRPWRSMRHDMNKIHFWNNHRYIWMGYVMWETGREHDKKLVFLNTKAWIPGGGKSIFTVVIKFANICTGTTNRRIWRHNTSTSSSCGVTDQVGDVKLFSKKKSSMKWANDWADFCVQGINVRRFGNDFQPWFQHSWKAMPYRPTCDKIRYSG